MPLRSVVRFPCAIATALFAICMGCASGSVGRMTPETRVTAEAFFRMTQREQLHRFGSYDISVQYNIYLFGLNAVHPPALYLDDQLASGGIGTADVIRQAMLLPQYDHEMWAIIGVLKRMRALGYYDICADSSLMRRTSERIRQMKQGPWRARTDTLDCDVP